MLNIIIIVIWMCWMFECFYEKAFLFNLVNKCLLIIGTSMSFQVMVAMIFAPPVSLNVCLFLFFRCPCLSCATPESWPSRSAKSTSVSPSTCRLSRCRCSSAAWPWRRTRKCWRRTAHTLWWEHPDAPWRWSTARSSTWRTSNTLCLTSAIKCWSSWVSDGPNRLLRVVKIKCIYIQWSNL